MSEICDLLERCDQLRAEIAALKAERDEYVQMWREGCNDRAALEEMLIIAPRDEAEAAFHRIAHRALEGK